jgi:hypothetical protein
MPLNHMSYSYSKILTLLERITIYTDFIKLFQAFPGCFGTVLVTYIWEFLQCLFVNVESKYYHTSDTPSEILKFDVVVVWIHFMQHIRLTQSIKVPITWTYDRECRLNCLLKYREIFVHLLNYITTFAFFLSAKGTISS